MKSLLNKKYETLKSTCPKIEDREQRDYSFNWNPYLKVQEGYRLTRLGDSYEAYMKIVTRSPKPNDQNVYEYKKLPRVLLKKWRGCFAKVNESLTSKGQKIRLHLEDYSQKRDMPYAVIVNKESDIESNDQLWLLKSSCAQLLKLSFHVLGLVDEAPSSDFVCRPKSPKDSMMNDMNEALYKIKRTGYEYVTYRCECDTYNTRNCPQLLSRGYQAWGKDRNLKCPAGTYLIKKYALKKDLWEWGQKNQAQVLSYYKRPFGSLGIDLLCQAYGAFAARYSHCQKTSSQTLIKNSQFQAILYPSCAQRNMKYVKCSKQSYSKLSCESKPECQKSSWLD